MPFSLQERKPTSQAFLKKKNIVGNNCGIIIPEYGQKLLWVPVVLGGVPLDSDEKGKHQTGNKPCPWDPLDGIYTPKDPKSLESTEKKPLQKPQILKIPTPNFHGLF